MIKTAMIMAAGMGTRFGHYTDLIPKGFIPFKDKPMVVRSIELLIECGIEKIVIGTGYKKEVYEELSRKYPQIVTIFSPRYKETNSMFTLYNSRELINDDFLLLESDLVFEKKAITSLMECDKPDVMLVSPVTKFQDQYYVECNDNGYLTNCSVNKEDLNYCGELVGIHKLSLQFFNDMCQDYKNKVDKEPKMGYEYELLYMSRNISPMYVLNIPGLQWYEIDDTEDLKYAENNIIL